MIETKARIRYAATAADAERVVELARREHGQSRWRDVAAFDAVAAAATVRSFVGGYNRTLLVSERGYIAGLVQDLGFSGAKAAIEYAWYAEDGAGLELLDRFKLWALNMGANHLVCHSYAGDGRLDQVLGRYKFQVLGSALVLDLSKELS